MKKVLILAFIVIGVKAFGQSNHRIKASEAYRHIGEFVQIRDSIYSGKIYKDSIAVLQIGKKDKSTVPLTVIILDTYKTGDDIKLVHTFRAAKASFYGIVLMGAGGPLMILDKKKNPRCISFEYRLD